MLSRARCSKRGRHSGDLADEAGAAAVGLGVRGEKGFGEVKGLGSVTYPVKTGVAVWNIVADRGLPGPSITIYNTIKLNSPTTLKHQNLSADCMRSLGLCSRSKSIQ